MKRSEAKISYRRMQIQVRWIKGQSGKGYMRIAKLYLQKIPFLAAKIACSDDWLRLELRLTESMYRWWLAILWWGASLVYFWHTQGYNRPIRSRNLQKGQRQGEFSKLNSSPPFKLQQGSRSTVVTRRKLISNKIAKAILRPMASSALFQECRDRLEELTFIKMFNMGFWAQRRQISIWG